MRGFGFFLGSRATRNDPVRLVDPRPLTDYGNDVETGNAALDGFELLSKASPDMQGDPPPVAGVIGPSYRGPAQDFEQ